MYGQRRFIKKYVRAVKKRNRNRAGKILFPYELNKDPDGATGTGGRYLSRGCHADYRAILGQRKIREWHGGNLAENLPGLPWYSCHELEGARQRNEIPRDLWTIRHPGQTMESSVHDRTRWKSSKRKDRIGRGRKNKRLWREMDLLGGD